MDKKEANEKINLIFMKVLQRVIPTKQERDKTSKFVKSLTNKLQRKLLKTDLDAEVHLEGSIAKDTWLANEKDIDLFIKISDSKFHLDSLFGFQKLDSLFVIFH